MDTFVPLFQTALWVGLILFAVLRFRRQLDEMIEVVETRIEKGAPLKAGPFELGEDFRTLAKEEKPAADLVLEQVKHVLPGRGI